MYENWSRMFNQGPCSLAKVAVGYPSTLSRWKAVTNDNDAYTVKSTRGPVYAKKAGIELVCPDQTDVIPQTSLSTP